MENLDRKGKTRIVFQRFPRHPQFAHDLTNVNPRKRANQLAYYSQQDIPNRSGGVFESPWREGRAWRGKAGREGRRARSVEQKFQAEREAVKAAHEAVMRAFHRAWQEHFQSFREREMRIILSFKQSQNRKVEEATAGLQLRREARRSPSPTARMNELARTRELMIKMEDFRGIAHVQEQMRKEGAVRERRREEEVERWQTAEELKLSASQTKKYGALVSSLEDKWQDTKRIYMMEQKRLRRKYKNYVAEMEHCHALQGTTLTDY